MSSKTIKTPTPRDIRIFGLVILLGFGIMGGIVTHRGHVVVGQGLWKGAGLVAVLAFVWPQAARPIYQLWMLIGMALGYVMSRVVLTVIYFGLFTPVAVFFRLRGRDELRRKKATGDTYWRDHAVIENKDNYKHLF